ncbi:MAG: cyclic nucleotide-binding domain-containing protein [Alphaproteobacteria bacterium]|jgi:sulfate permease, SulP family|nr:cyclic nucleotide-binding domain-containing protein [Alphaproteobacteria bacterium]
MSTSPIGSFLRSLTTPEILFPNLTAAVLIAVMNITLATSMGALVFSGDLAEHLSSGVALMLVGTAVGGVLIAALSGFKAVVSAPRSGLAPVFATMAAAVAISVGDQPGNVVMPTVVAAILVATIVNGVALYFMGQAKLGSMVRYIPYPVMGGFFAGLGYLLAQGGLAVALGEAGDFGEPSTLITGDALAHMAPALAFAVLFYGVEQRIKHWILLPAFLAGGLILFYGILAALGMSVDQAAAANWLPNLDTESVSYLPVLSLTELGLVHWPAVLEQAGFILVMSLISMIILLLDVSGIEIILNRDLDPNRELKAAGLGNIGTGLLGGTLGIQAASDTAFTFKLGGDRFLMILVYALIIGGALLAGPAPIAVIPTWILGGLLIYLGADFLVSWLWTARKSLPLSDYLVVLAILAVVARFGILEGVGVGIVLSIILFVHSYSKLSVIKASMSGAEHASNIDRHPQERSFLDERGENIQIFGLQGFLFFGTASRLLESIRARMEDEDRPPVRYLVLDFKHVDAVDTSAANSFSKLIQLCDRGGETLVFTGCSADVEEKLRELGGGEDDPDQATRIFQKLDEGVAWCEEKVLLEFSTEIDTQELVPLLSELLQDQEAAEIVASKFETETYKSGHVLFNQGDPGDTIYFVLEGEVSVVMVLPDDKPIHLRTFRSGAILGEMSLYTGAPRSATAKIKEDGIFCRLDRKGFEELDQSHPHVAKFFHAYIVRLMAERLARANKEIVALSK